MGLLVFDDGQLDVCEGIVSGGVHFDGVWIDRWHIFDSAFVGDEFWLQTSDCGDGVGHLDGAHAWHELYIGAGRWWDIVLS